jgi:predicted dehydrogenase
MMSRSEGSRSARNGGKKFSVALLGCGAVVQDLYLPALRRLSAEINFTLCFDIEAENAQRVAQELGATAVTGGLEELLVSPQTDGVVIALPNNLHAMATVVCVAAGRHVFCEKPVATHSEGCDEIECAMEATDRVLTVNLLRRLFPSSMAIRQLLQREGLGELVNINVAEGQRGGDSRSGFQFIRDKSGGGVTLDRGSHVFDLLIHWLGPPVPLSYSDNAGGGCESTSFTKLRWPDGPQGSVKISKQEPWDPRVMIKGDGGTAQWMLSEPAIARMISVGDDAKKVESILAPIGKRRDFTLVDAFANIFRLWVGACRGENENPAPLSEARIAIDLITQCYSVREPFRMNWLEFQE